MLNTKPVEMHIIENSLSHSSLMARAQLHQQIDAINLFS